MRSCILYGAILAACLLLVNSCSIASTANVVPPETIFVGSTPGDSEIKSLLGIRQEKQIDFIRWELKLNDANNAKRFALNVAYGEGQPNTMNFKGGGEVAKLQGSYTVSRDQTRESYELKIEKDPATVI